MAYLILRRAALKEDNWTYGDWRQYVAFLDDGSAVCCRVSALPDALFMVGFAITALATMCALLSFAEPVVWSRLGMLTFIGFALIGPALVQSFTSWRLVVPVSKRMQPDEHGDYWRDI